jgi:ParB family transcriptional regulator, chromosome partitioning protein
VSLPAIPIEKIHPHRENARQELGDLTELAASIRAVGLLQPLVVVADRTGWTVLDDTSLMLAAAMHKQLEPIERARAFQRLREGGLTVAEIARRTGYSPSTVSSGLLLVMLPQDAQTMVERKELTVAQATDLARQNRARAGGEVTASAPHATKPKWLARTHRLADHVLSACVHRETRAVIGGVGCGQCWEHAIRFDEHLKGVSS